MEKMKSISLALVYIDAAGFNEYIFESPSLMGSPSGPIYLFS